MFQATIESHLTLRLDPVTARYNSVQGIKNGCVLWASDYSKMTTPKNDRLTVPLFTEFNGA